MGDKKMRKALLIALCICVVGSLAYGQTSNVLSRNAVGYVKITVRSNTLFVARNDFESLGTAPLAISNAIGDQLPGGSQIILWDKVGQTFKSPIIKTFSGWGPQGSNRLARGDAFFIRLPSTVPSNSYQVYFMGEVPDRTKATGTGTTFNILPGLNLNGDPYPVSRKWTNTAMAGALPGGSQLLTWNETNQTYNSPIIKTFSGWGPVGNALTIEPGVGFWIRSTGTVTFSEGKPYTWP